MLCCLLGVLQSKFYKYLKCFPLSVVAVVGALLSSFLKGRYISSQNV